MSVFKVLERTLRYFVAFFIFVYGAAKPLQFGYGKELPSTPVNELSGMELMWCFFGYSDILPLIIGVLQVGGAILLLFPRTKITGIIILIPVMANIVLFDIFYQVNRGATINAIVFLCILIVLLIFERNKIHEVLKIITAKSEKDPKATLLFFTSAVIAAILFFVYTNIIQH